MVYYTLLEWSLTKEDIDPIFLDVDGYQDLANQ